MFARPYRLVVYCLLTFAMFGALGQASAALILTGPPNDLHGSGTIATSGATETWTFDVNPAGGAFDLLGTSDPTLRLSWEVLNPSNTVIAAATAASVGAPLHQFAIPLTDAGTWTIIVDGFGSTTGGYTLEAVGNADAHILGTIPEPGTLALLGLSLAGLAESRSSKR